MEYALQYKLTSSVDVLVNKFYKHHVVKVLLIIIIIIIIIRGLFGFRILISEIYESIWTFVRIPWTGDQTDAGLSLHRTTQHRKTQTHTSVPRAGFEPTIPVFERC
jgi:hypothetical protein